MSSITLINIQILDKKLLVFFPLTKPNLYVQKVEIQFQRHFGPLDLKKRRHFLLQRFS